MGWLVDRVEDGDAFQERYERVCARVDHCYAADALCEVPVLSTFYPTALRASRL
jgi:hypothetical protein